MPMESDEMFQMDSRSREAILPNRGGKRCRNGVFINCQAAPENVRELFRDTFDAGALVEVTSEVEELAAQYIEKGVIVPKYTDDARHVATCTVAKLDYLVSWNFRHLVNVQREAGFNAVNLLQGYQAVRIVNPLELIYGKQD